MKDISEFYLYYENRLIPLIKANAERLKSSRIVYLIVGGFLLLVTLWLCIGFSSIIPIIAILPLLAVLLVKSFEKVAYPDYRASIVRGIAHFMGQEYIYRIRASLGKYSFKNSGIYFKRLKDFDVSDIISREFENRCFYFAFVRGYKLGVPWAFLFNAGIYLFTCMSLISIMQKIADGNMLDYFVMFYVFRIIYVVIPILLIVDQEELIGADTYRRMKFLFVDTPKRIMKKTVFECLFLSMDVNKKFKGHTAGFTRSVSDNFRKFHPPYDMDEVKLENDAFMGRFCIYASHEDETRKLLTPPLMEALTTLSIRLEKPMNFSFYRGRLFITFEQKDLIEEGLRSGADSFEAVGELYISIAEIMDTAFRIDLNEDIFTKKD